MRTLKKEEEVGKFVPLEKRSRKEEGTNEGITGAGRENHGEKCGVNTFTQEERERGAKRLKPSFLFLLAVIASETVTFPAKTGKLFEATGANKESERLFVEQFGNSFGTAKTARTVKRQREERKARG